MTVKKIPAKMPRQYTRKRTAAYARVSGEKDAQRHSLSAQVSYYSQKIQANPAWEYAGVYADEAYSGTKSARPEFQRLLTDCRVGKIDIVLTKSISRFARNTVDTLEILREFKKLNVAVHFERENIWSNSGDGEFMLTILACVAQEESRSVSENCKWRIRKNFAEGIAQGVKLLGYDRDMNIIPDEAEIVRRIFADYLSGDGVLRIQKKLLAQGISITVNGLRGILRNEKYAGDLVLQKYFTADHLTKQKRINRGELPQYTVHDNHEPIIDRATFNQTQEEMTRRAARHNQHPPQFTSLTGLITCGICGANYRRKHAAAGSKYEKIVWICGTFNTLGKAHCASQQIPEDILKAKIEEHGAAGLQGILVPDHNQLRLIYNEKQIDTTWAHKSRRDSWTPEMREKARQQACKK